MAGWYENQVGELGSTVETHRVASRGPGAPCGQVSSLPS